jgi:hypothetical protein
MMLEKPEDQQKAAYAIAMLLSLPFMAEVQRVRAEGLAEQLPAFARAALTRQHEAVAAEMRGYAAEVAAGRISATEFGDLMAGSIRRSYYDASLFGKIAAGRFSPLSPADLKEVETQCAAEVEFARGFARDLGAGKVSQSELDRRVDMYAHAVREVFNRSWAHHKDTNVFRWHMTPGAQHCVACVMAEAGAGQGLPGGVYRIGELPFYPGRSPVCLDNCMCWLEAVDGDIGAPQIREPASSGANPQ